MRSPAIPVYEVIAEQSSQITITTPKCVQHDARILTPNTQDNILKI